MDQMRPVEWIILVGQAWNFTPLTSSLPKIHKWVIPEKNSVTKKYRSKCCYIGKNQEIYTISLPIRNNYFFNFVKKNFSLLMS